jgi:lipoprotein-anchoring transpeptidase ErfK/SrfK
MSLKSLSRRDFLKLGAVAAMSMGNLAFRPSNAGSWFSLVNGLADFPDHDRLGRVCKGFLEVKARPDLESETIDVLYEDAVVPWLREVTGSSPAYIFNNQRWVEIPDGYVYSPLLQPVKNTPNEPVARLPETSLGPGMWVEVTVPYVETVLDREPSSNSWVEAKIDEGLPVRFYYNQIFWVDRVRQDEQSGVTYYRVNPNYYGGYDLIWAAAPAFRPLTAEELAPIRPEVDNKKIEVDVSHQTLTCYEGNDEVYFCRVSTGALYDYQGTRVDNWETPQGQHRITRKYISLQMSGGTTGAGYDLPGIGYSTIFATGGVAIHSTFWHNNYGDTMSHGCVNVTPDDAKWIFRWSNPAVKVDPGSVDVTVTGESSTPVSVTAL